jgi:hypothetical protein
MKKLVKIKNREEKKGVVVLVKKLLSISIILLSVLLVYGQSDAMDGKCGDCHTMHSSQDGTATTPNDNLTKGNCVGCHNGGVVAAPNVFGTATRTAGGTFAATVVDIADGYKKVHNVRDISWTNDESPLMSVTPGGTETGHAGTPDGAAELTCSGTTGCHGKHDGTGFKGFHHGSYPDAYRFLQYYDGSTHTDILGKGSSTRESGGATSGNHNVYYANSTAGAKDSISAFCSMCHGEFHGTDDTQASTPFKRHPTELVIPSAWDSIGTGVTIAYETTPFGFNGADYTAADTNTVYAADLSDNPRVVCVSCHKAHGSDYNDLLRFDYDSMVAGGGGTAGCLACHTGQR